MLELSRRTVGNPHHPPLVFLHGFLGSKEDWEAMLPYFQDQFFCLTFDLPGHGKSPHLRSPIQTIQAAVQTITSLPPIYLGYSLGGRIALQLQEGAFATVVLSAHPGLETQEEKTLREQIDKKWCEKLLHLPFETFIAEWYAQPIFNTLHKRPSLLQEIIQRRIRHNHPQKLADTFMEMSLSQQSRVTDFSCPTLFLYGEEDWKYRHLYCKLPNTVTVRCIKQCGHVIHLENTAECAKQILDWFKSYVNIKH